MTSTGTDRRFEIRHFPIKQTWWQKLLKKPIKYKSDLVEVFPNEPAYENAPIIEVLWTSEAYCMNDIKKQNDK